MKGIRRAVVSTASVGQSSCEWKRQLALTCNNTGHMVSVDQSALCQARSYGGEHFNTERLQNGIFSLKPRQNLRCFCQQPNTLPSVRPIFISTAIAHMACVLWRKCTCWGVDTCPELLPLETHLSWSAASWRHYLKIETLMCYNTHTYRRQCLQAVKLQIWHQLSCKDNHIGTKYHAVPTVGDCNGSTIPAYRHFEVHTLRWKVFRS